MAERQTKPSADSGEIEAQSRALDELRVLLFGKEATKLSSLAQRVEDPVQRVEDISGVLPQAFAQCIRTDSRLAGAMAPAVEAALKSSVRRDPKVVSDALFPVMGPAIRRAVADALRRVIQTFTRALDNSLSWQGLRWRWEARRTGRPLAEVILRHTLVFRVEQVFLIHRATGLLLCHAEGPNPQGTDEDLVAGMLTAIRDFVRDSFQAAPLDELNSIEVGDLSLWIEGGPSALLAVAIRGEAPLELRQHLQSVLEDIHRFEGHSLQHYEGEVGKFDSLQPVLESCLQSRFQEQHARLVSWRTVLIVAGVLILGTTWGVLRWKAAVRRDAFVANLRQEPGLILTQVANRQGTLRVSGLKDPLASDPAARIAEFGLLSNEIAFHWEPYFALTPEFVLRRARARLEPPDGVRLAMEGSRLELAGTAPASWIQGAVENASRIPGVESVDATRLTANEPLQVARPEDPVAEWNRELLGHTIHFETGRTEATNAQVSLNRVAELGRQLADKSGDATAPPLVIQLMGRADRRGPEALNTLLSRQRAEWVRDALVAQGVARSMIEIQAVGSREPLHPENPESPDNRCVTISVKPR